MSYLEHTFVNLFNTVAAPNKLPLPGGLPLGRIVGDDGATNQFYFLPTIERTKHISVMGKTGSGKSYLIRHLAEHDIKAGRGFLLFDLHGDLILPLLYILVRAGVNPRRVVLIDPGSREYAVGLNPIEADDEQTRFLLVAEVTRTLAERWDFKGARTEELLRNALFVLSANAMTILEVGLLLSHDGFRAAMLKGVPNQDVREYFELRYDPLSEAMKATMREPVLNKLSELTSDPHFRYILGQRKSTISFDDILDSSAIVLVSINKGALGIHALTLGALVYTKLKAAVYRRRKRELFTVYADEMQNLLSADADFDVLFSEARKFGVSIVTANQFSAQLPPKMRSAVQAINTRICFQLSAEDAEQVSRELSSDKRLAERLKNLPPRHFIVRQGNHKPYEVVTPDVVTAKVPADDFYRASNSVHAVRREEIERDILARRPKPQQLKEVLDDWE